VPVFVETIREKDTHDSQSMVRCCACADGARSRAGVRPWSGGRTRRHGCRLRPAAFSVADADPLPESDAGPFPHPESVAEPKSGTHADAVSNAGPLSLAGVSLRREGGRGEGDSPCDRPCDRYAGKQRSSTSDDRSSDTHDPLGTRRISSIIEGAP
jgi:hypothetical protein